MSDTRRYAFAGNRAFVLEEMRSLGLVAATVFAVAGSFLERRLIELELGFVTVRSKRELIDGLTSAKFDIFISNGCPWILPITKLQTGNAKRFVNIHPSILPDLRGVDPVPGALLFDRQSGATCHLMTDEIDGGPIIARAPIDVDSSIDCGLLYQMSFLAEVEAFRLAHARDFQPLEPQKPGPDDRYYTIRDEDLEIDWREPNVEMLRRIRAFGTRSRGAWFRHDGEMIKVRDAEIVVNRFLSEQMDSRPDNSVIFRYESNLLIKRQDCFLKLKSLEGNVQKVKPGDILGD